MGEFRGRAEGAAPLPSLPPPFFLGFILKTIIETNRLSSGIVQSGLFCGYGARLRCHRNFFVPLFFIFLDQPLEWGGETDVRIIVDTISMITVTFHCHLTGGSFGNSEFLQEKRNGSGKCYFGRQAVSLKNIKRRINIFTVHGESFTRNVRSKLRCEDFLRIL